LAICTTATSGFFSTGLRRLISYSTLLNAEAPGFCTSIPLYRA
jgi:hypothetical protein